MRRISLEKLSLFQKVALVMVFTVLLTSLVTHAFVLSTTASLVRSEIESNSRSLTELITSQLSEKYNRYVSMLASLSMDEDISGILAQEPETAYERIQAVDAMRTKMLDYINKMFEGDLMIAAVSLKGYAYATWDMFSPQMLLDVQDAYLAEGQPNALYARLERALPVNSVGRTVDTYILLLPVHGDSAREIVGVVAAFLPLTWFEGMLDTGSDSQPMALVDAQGEVLAISGSEELIIPAGKLAGYQPSDSRHTLQYHEDDHGWYITQRNIARTQLTVVNLVSEQYVNHQIWQMFRPLLISAALTLLMVTFVSAWLMRGITRPIKTLTEQLVHRDYGSFEQANPQLGRNEVRMLEESFQQMQANIERLNRENAQKEQDKRDTEIKALQAQIQPHFLFNTLNTIRCAILNGNDEKAAETVMNLTMLLRMTLVKGDALVPLREEVETVGYYADILRMRSGLAFALEADIPEALAAFPLPKLILQPLVENSIIHGFAQQRDDGIIQLRAHREGAWLYIDVRNNGAPLTESYDLTAQDVKQKRFSGIGIDNVNDRLKLYYGRDSGVLLFMDGGWTVSRLKIAVTEA